MDFFVLGYQTTSAPASGPNPNIFVVGLVLFMGVYLFLMFRGNKREKQKKQDLLGSIKKNDRVMTIGGIIGTVVLVKDHEVVLKVDETTNTKMTFRRSAIQQKLQDEGAAGESK